jgi:hypothetical protein
MTSPKRPKLDPVTLRWLADRSSEEAKRLGRELRFRGESTPGGVVALWRASIHHHRRAAAFMRTAATEEEKRR